MFTFRKKFCQAYLIWAPKVDLSKSVYCSPNWPKIPPWSPCRSKKLNPQSLKLKHCFLDAQWLLTPLIYRSYRTSYLIGFLVQCAKSRSVIKKFPWNNNILISKERMISLKPKRVKNCRQKDRTLYLKYSNQAIWGEENSIVFKQKALSCKSKSKILSQICSFMHPYVLFCKC